MTRSAENGIPPLVYAGPTISRREVEAVLPGADVRPPVRRGDLYRDRTLRYSVLVVIDGVFHQDEAVPIREVVDVAQDGAWVVGASSMGALRAAECWPAGVDGVGAVYRLFRRGRLESDDEVAVAFDPDDPGRSSVALVNVRAAVAAARRRGVLPPEVGRRIVEEARDTFYPDRHWRLLLRRAGVHDPDGALEGRLSAIDLKRTDAGRALRYVARRIAVDPSLAHRPRRGTGPFVPSEARRERPPAAGDGRTPDELRLPLVAYLLASGRYPLDGAGHSVMADGATVAAERIWRDLEDRGELDACLFRLRALRDAPNEARRIGITPGPAHRASADREIAGRHGCASWSELEGRLDPTSPPGSWILDYREALPWAVCLREALFRPN